MKVEQAVFVVFDFVKLGPQRIQKQRADELEDVFLTGVMRPQIAPGLLVHDALEQAAEDGGRNCRPVQRTGIEQGGAHGGVEVGQGQGLFKQFAVDVGEGGQLLIEVFAAFVLGGVEHLKQLGQAWPQVAAVFAGALFNELAQRLRGLEDAGVVRKQAKQQAHQQHLQRVAVVAAGVQGIVQAAHALGSANVYRVLRLDGLHLVPGDKAKQAHVLVQIGQGKFGDLSIGQVVDAKAGKVAHHDELGQVALGNAGEVAQGLVKRGIKVFAARLLLDQEHSGPEQIDKTLAAAVLLDVVLEAGHALVGDAEDFKKVDPKGFGLRIFIGGIGPSAGKGQGAGFDFVPRQGHGAASKDKTANVAKRLGRALP